MIREQKQLAALSAAARQEIVDVLERMGTVSITELAAALGRPADALYFHVRALARAGLVQNVGHRVRRNGKEALYRTIAPELQLQYEPRNSANRKAVSAIVDSMLRLAMRDFRRSFQAGNVTVSGPKRELWASRKVGRLSPVQVARLNDRIKGVTKQISARHRNVDGNGAGTGRLYAVTVILTPLDHRNKADQRTKAMRSSMPRTESAKKRP